MSDPKYSGTAADWTQLLSDPALVSHLGELLQVYREAAPEKRDEALLEAMRKIKGGTAKVPVAPQVPPSPPVAQAGAVVPPAPAMPVMSPAPAQGSPPEIAPVAPPEQTNHREEEIVSGMYKEIQNLLRYSA